VIGTAVVMKLVCYRALARPANDRSSLSAPAAAAAAEAAAEAESVVRTRRRR